jgi:integrase
MVGRTLNRLTALAVNKAKEPGMYADGGGLYLQVSRAGTKSWIFRFTMAGSAREMGLGPAHTVNLQEARDKALACRKQKLDGIDPIEARARQKNADSLEAARAVTFDQAATRFIASNKAGWKNAKHGKQWKATLDTYASPVFGSVGVGDVDTALVMKALEPIWAIKPETAGRVRGRIEAILDWASARGYRVGENPARWRGHLEKLLPAKSKVRAVEHHAALPYSDIADFLQSLRAQAGAGAQALEFAIVTAARTSEVLGATWDEIDLTTKTWTVPAARMKAKKEHRIPLSPAAIKLLERLNSKAIGKYLFPGARPIKPLSNMAMLATLRRMDRGDLTAHGFRSTFRDWAAERTSFQNEVVEMALAHTIGDKVEAAYRRGDLFDKRRRLMDAWGAACSSVSTVKPASGRRHD